MKVTVQIVIDAQDGTPPAVEQVAVIARDDLTMASAGLALAEAHEVLSEIQHHLVTAQAVGAASAGRDCASCGVPAGARTPGTSCCAPCSARCGWKAHGTRRARAPTAARPPLARWRPWWWTTASTTAWTRAISRCWMAGRSPTYWPVSRASAAASCSLRS